MSNREITKLNRFQTKSITDEKFVSIHCTEGSLWVTAGCGFGDIVLRKGQNISLAAKDMIVMEALEESIIFISTTLSAAAMPEMMHS